MVALRRLLLPLLVTAIAALGLTVPAQAATPAPALKPASTITVIKDVRYTFSSWGPAAFADVYYPNNGQARNRTLIVWHGGGWEGGDKADMAPLARKLALLGWTVVAGNYRLSQEARWPAQVIDGKSLVRAARSDPNRYHIHPDSIAVAGVSAGGTIALTVAATPERTDWDQGLFTNLSSSAQAVVSAYGPTDIPAWVRSPCCTVLQMPGSFVYRWLGGSTTGATAVQASPVTHVTAGDPATLLWHGDADPLVPLAQSQSLHTAQVAAGVDSTLWVEPGMGHGDASYITDAFAKRLSTWLAGQIT